MIEAHTGAGTAAARPLGPRRGNSRSLKYKKSVPDQKSALLGISDEMRKSIKDSWALISVKKATTVGSPEQSNLNKFFEYVPFAFAKSDPLNLSTKSTRRFLNRGRTFSTKTPVSYMPPTFSLLC